MGETAVDDYRAEWRKKLVNIGSFGIAVAICVQICIDWACVLIIWQHWLSKTLFGNIGNMFLFTF